MSSFVPTNYDFRTALVFCYHLKKTAAESHRLLVEAYGEHALGKTQCFEWFKKFKSGNFDVRNEDRGKPPKKFEDWDQKGIIYYELLKPGETVNTNCYQQQMIDLNRALQEKRPDYRKRQHKVIFLHDNAPSHTAKCIWWDQKGVLYYELLKPCETINGERYRTQLIRLKREIVEKRPEYATRHEAIIFHHDNARPHVAIPVNNYL